MGKEDSLINVIAVRFLVGIFYCNFAVTDHSFIWDVCVDVVYQ